MTGSRMKFLVSGGLIVFALIIWFAFVTGGGVTAGAAYDISLAEFRSASSRAADDDVRVRGRVEEGSIEQKPGSAVIRFHLVDGPDTLTVRYDAKDHGPVPDTFVDGAMAIVTGSLDSDDIFQAHTLQAKCPSKYEGAQAETASR